ncbi:WD repeat-containing protein 27-like [Lineus longissimus]|uniref:WD repeat-containing protein 27-like n=1 Tax=Lineus longissimus TaxID=88925 RepID=UPI002B4C62FE
MTCAYKHAIRPNASLSHVQIATNGTYLVLPYTRNTVGVWSLQDLACKPLELEGHRRAVTALNVSHYSSPTLLCSAAEDFIIVWNIEHARASLAAGNQIRGKVIGKTYGEVQYVTFSRDDQMVAVCAERTVYILKTQHEELEATLEGHSGTVTCAEFCPHYAATLVTGSDDRTFKVWDILNSCLVYQSAIISSSPFISLAMNPQVEQFAIGTSDGQVRVYDLTDGNGFRMLNHIDVDKMVFRIKQDGKLPDAPSPRDPGPKTISSRPSWQRNPDQNPSDLPVEDESEAGNAVLGLYYKYPPSAGRPDSARKLSFLQADDTVVSNLLDVAPILVVGTTGSLIQINIRTLDCCSHIDLQEPLVDEDDLEEPNKLISAAGSYCFGPSRKHQESWCIIGSLFQRVVHILNLAQPTQKDLEAIAKGVQRNLNSSDTPSGYVPSCSTEPEEEEQPLTVLSRVPLCAKSPLRSELVPKTKERPPISSRRSSTSSISSSSSTPGLIDKKGKIVDAQPLTFKTQIKSSGYTAESPRTKMFQPQTNFSKNKPNWKTSRSSSMDSTVSKASIKEYPMDSEPPTNLHIKIEADVKPTAITKCRFSGDGQYLACALTNKSGQVFKMPLSSGKASSLLGHNSPLNHIHWSRDSKWMVTSADDRRACIWSKGQSDPVMIIDTMRHNMDIDKEGKPRSTKENPLFTKELRHAQFYFMDKFIMLTSGNAFYLYKYHLDPSKSDIKRYLTNNRYRLVKTFQMEEAQGITAFTAVNSFNSYISFSAGTNKSVEVFDLNVGKSVRVVADAHTRPVHTICLNEGSSFVSHPPSAYDLYVTAAAGDCIKMWDLRTNRCVQRYEGHQDRVHPCGVAISPCSRFIATGAEDRSAYIYDVRAGTYLHKLTGHTDVVTDVAFHPVYAQLVTTTLDGKIRLFKEK